MSKPCLFPSSGFFAATPSFGADGEVIGLRLDEIVAFMPIYASDAEADTIASVQPLVADWDGIEHPEPLVMRPDGVFVSRRNQVGKSLRRGSGDSMYTRKAHETREAPKRGQRRPTGSP